MSLRDEVRAESGHQGAKCRAGLLLDSMTPEDRAELVEVMGDRLCQSAAISKVLARRGLAIPEQTVSRHRRGVCQCPSQTT